MKKILIFGGTKEGREIGEFVCGKNISAYICTATEYGSSLLPDGKNIISSSVRLNEEEMENLMKNEKFDAVFDATHPYADIVSKNIKLAAEKNNIKYVRVLRKSEKTDDKNIIFVSNTKEAAEFLKEKQGNVFVTTGSKELGEFASVDNFKERIYARILPMPNMLEKCLSYGFETSHIYCMQGPFSEEMNVAMINMCHAEYMVTKESGKNGGFEEKIKAAEKCGVKIIVIGRPVENEEGISLEMCKKMLVSDFGVDIKKKIGIIGCGVSNEKYITNKAKNSIKKADAVVGSKRLIADLAAEKNEKYFEYEPEKILKCIEESVSENIAVLFSGSISFFSGAEKLRKLLDEKNIEYSICGGISSAQYFIDKIGIGTENVCFISLHGRNCDPVSYIKRNEKTFMLLGGENNISSVCRRLVEYEMGETEVFAGENLGYENENIIHGKAVDFIQKEFGKLSVMAVINKNFSDKVQIGINDDCLERAKVPMTKSEVRAVSVSKLGLKKNSVVFDVGSGTGSVSIEAALLAYEGKVYSIEKNADALELTKKNKMKFKASNIEIINGWAPDVLKNLPVPTHCFIGGSSGKIKEIIQCVLEKNKNTRFVINAIALETIAQVLSAVKEFGFEAETVQLSVSKGKKIGNINMLMANNPIFIVSFGGENDD